jgi:hypothetical protein
MDLEKRKHAKAHLVNSLRVLTVFCTSGARYQHNNPYSIGAIKQALQTLADYEGLDDYLDVEISTEILPMDSLRYLHIDTEGD